MFQISQAYTREEINQTVGGSLQSFLPSKNGEIVAACVTKEMNPFAPQYIIAGTGPRITKSAEILAKQTNSIPVFIKKAPKKWIYRGMFKVDRVITNGELFSKLVREAKRDLKEVRLIIKLKLDSATT